MRGTSSKSENLLINLKRTIEKKKQNKDDVLLIKTLQFKETVAVLYGVFAQFLSKNSSFILLIYVLILTFFSLILTKKKQRKKDQKSRKKTLQFVEIVAALYWVFDQFSSIISPAVIFQFVCKNSSFNLLFEENTNKDDVPGKKNVIL